MHFNFTRWCHRRCGRRRQQGDPSTPQPHTQKIKTQNPERSQPSTPPKVRLFTLESGRVLKPSGELERHRSAVTCVAFSPNGALLATADSGRELLLWDTQSRQVSQKDWQYHSAKITCVAWSPDSSRLATGSIDTNVIVWSVATPDSVR